jgi:hypothetical protein
MSQRRKRLGRTLSNGPPEGQRWAWMTETMLGAITMRALGVHARRILDFLLHEHARHSGRCNGALPAPYKQLEAWGVTAADVSIGFEELFATGYVRKARQGLRQAGGGTPSLYTLTWLPTHYGSPQEAPPTHDWLTVLKKLREENVGTVSAARAWLKREVSDRRRGWTKTRNSTTQSKVCPPPK